MLHGTCCQRSERDLHVTGATSQTLMIGNCRVHPLAQEDVVQKDVAQQYVAGATSHSISPPWDIAQCDIMQHDVAQRNMTGTTLNSWVVSPRSSRHFRDARSCSPSPDRDRSTERKSDTSRDHSTPDPVMAPGEAKAGITNLDTKKAPGVARVKHTNLDTYVHRSKQEADTLSLLQIS